MWEEVRARSVTINYCAFVSFMIIIVKGNLWSTSTTATECLFAYEENSSVVDLDVPPYL
jgi:hypothetical protein